MQFYDLLLAPRKSMLRVLADYTVDEEERKKLLKLASDDPDDQDYFNKYIQDDMRTVFEVLKDFPGVKPPVDHFLEVLPKLQPRFYSISSSPNVRFPVLLVSLSSNSFIVTFHSIGLGSQRDSACDGSVSRIHHPN